MKNTPELAQLILLSFCFDYRNRIRTFSSYNYEILGEFFNLLIGNRFNLVLELCVEAMPYGGNYLLKLRETGVSCLIAFPNGA
jgi:hypothetical protein